MRPRILIFRKEHLPNGYYTSGSSERLIGEMRVLGEVTVAPYSCPADERLRLLREHDILVSDTAPPLPEELALDRGRLKCVFCLHGGIRPIVSHAHLKAGLIVTNWGDTPGHGLATLSMTLLLALLRELPAQIETVRNNGWHLAASLRASERLWGGSAEGLRVGIFGMGFAGRCFTPMARSMGMILSGYDPYAEPWPEEVRRTSSLNELFTEIETLVICAALTDQTRKSVTSELLARLPDGGIVINTARGAIVDQDALFNELLGGRLRAGLDVLEPDCLPPDHPVRLLPNCILTAHHDPANRFNNPSLGRNERYVLENIKRHIAGQSLRWVVDLALYDRMS
jgi:phosphoglycerate dehydrogenase-like enzyme